MLTKEEERVSMASSHGDITSGNGSPSNNNSSTAVSRRSSARKRETRITETRITAASSQSDVTSDTGSPGNNSNAAASRRSSARNKETRITETRITASPKTAKKNYTGLSELAKQLRVLQAKNEYQGNEIERLERQLRIMSELHGVSVSDLRNKLESACQQEAHNELQNQVASLRAQLEEMKLKAIMTQNTKKISSMMKEESKSREMMNLELRVGELEETDLSLRKELQSVYTRIQEQTKKATTAESAKKDLEKQIKSLRINTSTDKQSLFKITSERDEYLSAKDDLAKQVRQLQLDLQIEKDKNMSLTNQINLQSQFSSENGKKKRETSPSPYDEDDDEIMPSTKSRTRSSLKSKSNHVSSRDGQGELVLQEEIAILYEKLRQSESRVSKLESDCKEYQAELEKVTGQLSSAQEEQKQLKNTYDFAVEEHNQLYQKLCDVELQLSIERDTKENLEEQIFAHQSDMSLQKEQYHSRFILLQEQTNDMKQQMASLYTACDLLQEDCSNEEERRKSLYHRLGEADSSIARQLHSDDAKEGGGGGASPSSRTTATTTATSRTSTPDNSIHSPFTSTIATIPTATATSANTYSNYQLPTQATYETPPRARTTNDNNNSSYYNNDDYYSTTTFGDGVTTPIAVTPIPNTSGNDYSSQSSYHQSSSPVRSFPDNMSMNGSSRSLMNGSSRSLMGSGSSHGGGIMNSSDDSNFLMEGYLYKYDRNIFKGWKNRYFKLSSHNSGDGTYLLSYSDGPRHYHLKGTIRLQMGISTVYETTEFQSLYPNQQTPSQFIMALIVDPYYDRFSATTNNATIGHHRPSHHHHHQQQQHPPALYLATTTQENLDEWLKAFSIVTELKSQDETQEAIDHQMAIRMSIRM